ncbi:MAG: cbb3-type cytochrome c oxidase subunit I [Candidatus Hodgkinia cicadicola]
MLVWAHWLASAVEAKVVAAVRQLSGWDHEVLGKAYILFAVVSGIFGTVLSLLIRAELQKPGIQVFKKLANVLYKEESSVDKAKHLYNAAVTAHGLIMIFYMLMPILVNALGYLTLPLLVNVSKLALPKAGVLAFWMLVTSLVLALVSLTTKGTAVDYASATGWTLYPPLSGKTYHAGTSVDWVIAAVCLACISSLISAAHFIAVIVGGRHKNLKLTQMSLLAWGLLISSILLLATAPVLVSALTMLLMDRTMGTVFFDPKAGGDPALFQHLFWFFGHPEVYVLILPAFGIVSELISRFSRKPVFGKLGMILAMISLAVVGTAVWAHHMYTVGMSFSALKYFVAATMAVAVPTGIKVFSWLSTMWRGRIALRSPMIWALEFIAIFVIGGATGIQLANASLSKVLHDTYYVVAHFHYVLSIAAGFAVMAAWYYWFPKIAGVAYNERFSTWHAIVTFIAANATFLPQHFLGLAGMPRRCVDYTSAYWGWNAVSSVGSYVGVISFVIFAFVTAYTLARAKRCPKDPWKEW